MRCVKDIAGTTRELPTREVAATRGYGAEVVLHGRIWDEDVVRTVIAINDGRWVVPGKVAGGGMADMYTEVTKQSTTLYASDRDVWMFLVDEQHPVEIDGEAYFRGFIVSNSEVGNATFTVKTFLLKQVCMNRIIWGDIFDMPPWAACA